MEPNKQTLMDYSDGKALLRATLVERNLLLRDLEILIKIPQTQTGKVVKFETTKAQTLLYKLSEIEERMESLIRQINIYADMSGQPRMELITLDAF